MQKNQNWRLPDRGLKPETLMFVTLNSGKKNPEKFEIEFFNIFILFDISNLDIWPF